MPNPPTNAQRPVPEARKRRVYGGGLLFLALFTAHGVPVSVAELRDTSAMLRSWPHVVGTVTRSDLIVIPASGKLPSKDGLVFEYRYLIGSREHVSSRLADLHPHIGAQARALARRYPTGSSLTVYYEEDAGGKLTSVMAEPNFTADLKRLGLLIALTTLTLTGALREGVAARRIARAAKVLPRP